MINFLHYLVIHYFFLVVYLNLNFFLVFDFSFLFLLVNFLIDSWCLSANCFYLKNVFGKIIKIKRAINKYSEILISGEKSSWVLFFPAKDLNFMKKKQHLDVYKIKIPKSFKGINLNKENIYPTIVSINAETPPCIAAIYWFMKKKSLFFQFQNFYEKVTLYKKINLLIILRSRSLNGILFF